MAKTNSKVGKVYPVISSITVAPIQLISQDIQKWKNAINSARNTLNPRRRLLYDLYDNILMDGQLTTVINKRKSSITNKRFVFYKKGKEGETIDRIQEEIINTSWFDDMLNLLIDREFYGHVLMELVPGTEFPIGGLNHIPFNNVKPETGELLLNYMDQNGPYFRGEKADPALAKYLLEYGKPKDYGILMQIAQYVIYKRGGFGDWAQFAELFGMPFRVGEYDPFDPKTRDLLIEALENMGGAGYAAIPKGTSVKFENGNSNTGQSAVFSDLIKMCNEEISKMVLGGTMTTDNGSSRSQSETHQKGEDAITTSDLNKIEKFLNSTFKTKLIEEFNYSELKDGFFKVEAKEIIPLKDRILIDKEVALQVEINPDYWYNTYGVEMPEGGAKLKSTQQPEPTNDPKKKSKLSLSMHALYSNTCKTCTQKFIALSNGNDKEALRLARAIYNKKLQTGDIDKKLLKQTALKLIEGISEGYLRKPGDFTDPDKLLVKIIHENAYIFSGFKTYDFIKQATDLLLDINGEIKPFEAFKTDILSLDHTYNTVYLASEYNHAVASAQMASKWVDFEASKRNLKYSTAGDTHVREEHARLDQIIAPYNSEFWDKYYPPNGWGCRCDADETTSETLTDLSSVSMPEIPKLFQTNVGKTGTVFPEDHPYYDVSSEAKKRIVETSKKQMPK
jgi:hypothetical protein